MEEAAQPPLPSTMRALRKTRPENGAELLDVLVPAPGPGEVLLRVEAASIPTWVKYSAGISSSDGACPSSSQTFA